VDINQVQLVGRLADNVIFEPGTETTSARAVGRIIVNRPPNKEGKRLYDAIQIVGWGKNADVLAQFTSKGKEIGIIGSIRVNSVAPKKEGDPWKNYFEVMVREVQLGRDSNQAKMMKALQGGVDTEALNMEIPELLNDPRVKAAMQKFQQGAQPLTASSEVDAEPQGTADNPFSEPL